MTTSTLDLTHQQISDIAASSDNPAFFINKYITFNKYIDGLIDLKLTRRQETVIQSYHNNRFVFTPAERQKGKTILGSLYCLHYAIFNNNVKVGIAAPKPFILNTIRTRIYDILQISSLPPVVTPNIVNYNKSIISLNNGSEISFFSVNPSNVIGRTFDLLFLDEFGIVSDDNADEFMKTIMPRITYSIKSKLIINSTEYNKTLCDLRENSEKYLNDFIIEPLV